MTRMRWFLGGMGLALWCGCRAPLVMIEERVERPPLGEGISPIVHWEEILEHDGEKVHFHMVRADLQDRRCEARVIYGDDPDGEGPAVTQLMDPVVLAATNKVLVAVNANAFKGLPDSSPMERAKGWYIGKSIIPVGQVVADGNALEGCRGNRLMVWTDATNRVHTGRLLDLSQAVQGVSDWGGNLLSNGVYVSKNHGANHRTMVGTDPTKRWLFLLVADGEKAGTRSSGASFRECAEILLGCGCSDAIALDGGGSVMMALARPTQDAEGTWQNGPVVEASGRKKLRPIPVALAISARQ